jgi:Tfp pilus assembly protein PilF
LLAQNNEKLAEALDYAGTAVEQDPEEANYLDTYGYLLYRNGKLAQAAQSLAAAVQKYEGDRAPKSDISDLGAEPKRETSRLGTQVRGMPPMDVYEHLGLVNEALGDRGKALDAYRRALEVGGAAMPEAAKQRINSAIGRVTK